MNPARRSSALLLCLFASTAVFAQGLSTPVDPAVSPCTDFYLYACGPWMASHPIPADESRWARSSELTDRNLNVLRAILEKAAAPDPKRGETAQKIGDLYASCLDEPRIDAAGAKPIQPLLKRIAKAKTSKDLIPVFAELHATGVSGLFNLSAQPDMHDAQSMIVHVDQGGLTLPDRDYYLKDDPKSKETRDRYLAHVRKMLELLGDEPAAAGASAAKILALETSLAGASMDRAQRREPKNRDHKMTRAELSALAPRFEFDRYFKERGVTASGPLNNTNPEFFRKVDPLLESVPLEDWKTYLRWKVVNDTAGFLSKPFVEEDFAFNRAYLGGQKQDQPRWKKCTRVVDQSLGEALGQLYVAEAFGGGRKESMLTMVNNIEVAMARNFESLPWMTDTTKKQARGKLDTIRNHIGYPDKWRDYGTLTIRRDDFAGNAARAAMFESKRQLDKIGRPIDRDEWSMSPPTVNAYYRSSMNDINFPAGILQPPYFDGTAHDAFNYGGIGSVIGHELTHGFDDQGSQFDANGNFKSWWTAEDRAEFDKRTACIADEYAGFTAVDDVKLNGKLTLGENTADNGGVKIAFMALQELQKTKPLASMDGFTPEQLFFLGYAQVWCQNMTPEALRLMAKTNPHSPGNYRVNGVLQNSAEFQQAFGCSAGQPMASASPCRVW
jgi:endothelin-converting enzyme/putative endopeptidase